MRGIVAELNRKYAIILAQDGSFRKIKAKANMTVGSEIDLNQPAENVKVTKLITRVTSIAAAVLFALGIGYGAYSYTLPYSYVDVDINPSIELTVNVYDRIIKAEALNNDGKKVLNNSNLRNTRLEAGVSQLLDAAVEQGYLKVGTSTANVGENNTAGDSQVGGGNPATSEGRSIIENAILFTISSADDVKSGELKKELTGVASRELKKGGVEAELLVGETSIEQRDDARKFGVTPGKLALIEDAMEAEPELKLEELKKAAVRDLIKKAKDKQADEDKQKAAKEQDKDNSTGKGGSDTINRSSEPPSGNQGVNQERTTMQEQRQEQLTDLKSDNEIAPNDKNDKQNPIDSSKAGKGNNSNNSDNTGKSGKSGKSNNNNNSGNNNNNGNSNSNSNSNDSSKSSKTDNSNEDMEDVLKREKQQRQQLKDELLNQLKDSKYKQSGKQEEERQQSDEDGKSIGQSINKDSTQKDKKDNSKNVPNNK